MRVFASCAFAFLMLTLGQPLTAFAQDDRCPTGISNDACDQWRFERADKALSELVLGEISNLGKRSTNRLWQEEAKTLLLEAQSAWQAFRTAECKARSTVDVISARTRAGKLSACLIALTQQRIAQFKY
jgi:uncharacterized protein YecT (DUF1311 family)